MAEDKLEESAPADELCVTGIAGLDEILAGGLPANCIYLVRGDPGAGKTTLALQFLLEGVRRGEAVFYVTLSETRRELLKVARSHGWSLEVVPLLEITAIESMLRPEEQTTVFHSSELELNRVTQLLLDELRRLKPARVVFDSLSEFRLMSETPLRYRRQLLNLKQEFSKYRSTVLLLDDNIEPNSQSADPHVLSLAHGVFALEQHSPDYGILRRRLRVLKMRGVKFREGYHDFSICTGGLRVYPRLQSPEAQPNVEGGAVSSGLKEFDELSGGGLDRGTTTLIMGQAGTGKSSLALHYVVHLAAQGEKSVVFAFDESPGVMFRRAHGLGLPLGKYVGAGLISVQQVDPAEISPGEFANRIVRHVEDGCKLVVLDSLNGYLNAMPGEQYLYNQLHELSSFLNRRSVLTIFILAQHGLIAAAEAPVDISYLADTVVNLRFFEAAGSVRQALAVIKKRSGHHEKTIREFKLETGRGFRLGLPLKEFHGVLTTSPRFHGRAEQMLTSSDAVEKSK